MTIEHVFIDPTGKEHVITGPDSSTRDQAWAVLQTQIGTQKRPEPSMGDKAFQLGADASMGFVHGASNVLTGAAQLPKLVGLPPIGGQRWIDNMKADYASLKNDPRTYKAATGFEEPRTGAYNLGETAGEYATTSVVPGSAAAKLPKALNALRGPAGQAMIEGATTGLLTGNGNWSDAAFGAAGGFGTNRLAHYGTRIASMSHTPAEARFLRRSLALLGGGYAAESMGMGSGVGGALGTYMLLGTRPGRRILMGETKTQQMLAEALRRNPTVGGHMGGLVTSDLLREE